jgi:4-oxalocrotonate tautomerase
LRDWAENKMPHIIVKLWPGKSADQKARLSDAFVESVTSILGYGEASVSVALEEIVPGEWKSKVYDPDILGSWDQLTKQPGYDASAL